MADLSKIRLDGVDYNFKDAAARQSISNITNFGVAIVNSLPASNIDTHTIYFMSNNGASGNSYDEYMYIGGAWEKIGSTEIDLSNYLQSTDIADWAKASSKPTYTASEVGALPSTTTYVSSFNGSTGDITYTAPVTSVNGQTGAVTLNIPTIPTVTTSGTTGYLLFQTGSTLAPKSNSSIYAAANTESSYIRLGNNGENTARQGYITFINGGESGRTTYLKPSYTGTSNISINLPSTSGTLALTSEIPAAQVQSDWNATSGMGVILNKPTIPAATTVTQTLTSGTAIGAVNGTTLYAPTPYNDTALAARVSALEQIPWVTYYTGTSEPSNSQGQNGDIYLQTE